MPQYDPLFQLIKSLSKSEKRFFALSSSLQKGDKNYLKLFSIIDHLVKTGKPYDEMQVAKQMKNGGSGMQLPRIKHYLYQAILNSMRPYYSNQSIQSRIRHTLHDIKFLIDKGLASQADKRLQKLKKLAYRYEMYHQLLDISDMESRLISQVSNVVKYGKEIAEERAAIIRILDNINRYVQIHYNMLKLFLDKPHIKTTADDNKYRELLSQPLLKHSYSATSFQSKIYFYRTYQMYHFARQDEQEYETYSSLMVALYQKNPEQIMKSPESYAVALNNLMDIQRSRKRYKSFFSTLDELRTFASSYQIKIDKVLAAALFCYGYNQELFAYINQGDTEKATNLLPVISEGLDKHKEAKKSFLIYLYKNIALTYFLSGDYNRALEWITKVTAHESDDIRVRADIESLARILTIIIHYELGNTLVLDYYVRSAYRFLLKKNNLNPTERTLLSFIRNALPKVKSPADVVNAFTILKANLQSKVAMAGSGQQFENFDYLAWLESKITNRKFADIVKEKARTVS